MNKYIYELVESYIDSTEQLNQTLKNVKTLERMEDKAKESRELFIENILGKSTYRKYDNSGLFAPVPLSSIKLIKKDFDDMSMSFDEDRIL